MLWVRIPYRVQERLLVPLIQHPNRTLVCDMGRCEVKGAGVNVLLFHRKLGYAGQLWVSKPGPGLAKVLVKGARGNGQAASRLLRQQVDETDADIGLLYLLQNQNVEVGYVAPENTSLRGPVVLMLPGPGMQRMLLSPLNGGQERRAVRAGDELEPNLPLEADPVGLSEWMERNSRKARTVGRGNEDWGNQLLAQGGTIKVVVVGVGRGGSWLVLFMTKAGISTQPGVVAVDPDVVELGNIPDMFVHEQALGFPKPSAVVASVRAICPGANVIPIDDDLDNQGFIDHIRTADVVISLVDEESARLRVAELAALYHLVHIDATASAGWVAEGQVEIGGHIRCYMPGDKGCGGCMTHRSAAEVERMAAESSEVRRERRANRDWEETKAGSGLEILMPVLAEVLETLWGLLRGEVTESFWLHYWRDGKNRPRWSDWSRRRRFGRCPLCGKRFGMGELEV